MAINAKTIILAMTVGVFTLALLVFAILRVPDTSYSSLLEKYGKPHSQFYTRSDGSKIHFVTEGNRENPAVFLLHGSSGNLIHYDQLAQSLMRDFYVVRYDHMGHGFSGAASNDDYSAASNVAALDELAHHLELDEFSLLGHSMGGWIAWRYAAANPDKVDRLVLLAASGMPLSEGAEMDAGFGFKLLKSPMGPAFVEQIFPRSSVADSARKSVFDPKLATDEFVDMHWELARLPGSRRALAMSSRRGREIERANLARSIRSPTLLIWGDADTFTPFEMAAEFQKRIPDTVLIKLADVGHMPMIEAPDQIGPQIREFLLENLDNSKPTLSG